MNSTSELVSAFPPPPGVTPNFINPESIASQVVLCTILTLVFTIPLFVLRIYTKKYILKRIDPEDYSIILAILFALMYSIVNLLQLRNGVGRHIWDVTLPEFKRFIVTGIPSGISYALSTLFVKVSLAQFYIRVSLDKTFKMVTYAIMFVCVCYNLLGGFSFLWFCRPIHKLWDFTVQGDCVNMSAAFISFSALNVATDVALLLLPIWLMWGMHLPVWKKVGAVFILMTGSFVCAVSIIWMVLMPSLMQQVDVTYANVQSTKWCLIHTYVAIICACMPLLHSCARHHFPRLFPANERHGQGLVMITGCNVSFPSTDPEASPTAPKSNLHFGRGDAIHLESRATCNSSATEEKDGGACNGSLSRIHALFKPQHAVLVGSAHTDSAQ